MKKRASLISNQKQEEERATLTPEFKVTVPGKWVFSGEHGVLRGGNALAFPYPKFSLSLSFFKNENRASYEKQDPQILSLLGRACEFLKKESSVFARSFIEIQSDIPMGAGLGSSAAMSVAVAKLAIWKTASDANELIPLAAHLEDLFHGKSSGMDVSVIAVGAPILFSMQNKAKVLDEFKTFPKIDLHDTGLRGQTKICIEQVKTWKVNHSEEAQAVDAQMDQATSFAVLGFTEFQRDPKTGEQNLAKAMNLAHACFEAWGLVPNEIRAQRDAFLKQGALSAKLTGAGLGGFWIVLWPSKA
jgi:mevalonate kinase